MIGEGVLGLHDLRPMNDERAGDAAFVNEVFVEPERRVGGVGPFGAVALIGIGGARHDGGVVTDFDVAAVEGFEGAGGGIGIVVVGVARGHAFGAATVIGEEED